MLTTMTESEWAIVLQVFRASRSRRGDKGRDDRKFLEGVQLAYALRSRRHRIAAAPISATTKITDELIVLPPRSRAL